MNGPHDMGGMHGFGPVEVEQDEPVFHARWEARVRALVSLTLPSRGNIDAFRHAIERIAPDHYLSVGYYGRWLRGLETTLVEAGVLAPGAVDATLRGEPVPGAGAPVPETHEPRSSLREIDTPPRFAVGDEVRTRNLQPAGHTRLPAYARGLRGRVARVHPSCVFPDTHAHGLGEDPQYVYAVRFEGRDLWGGDTDPRVAVHVDLFERYLEPA